MGPFFPQLLKLPQRKEISPFFPRKEMYLNTVATLSLLSSPRRRMRLMELHVMRRPSVLA
jgi:hypothetical protein